MHLVLSASFFARVLTGTSGSSVPCARAREESGRTAEAHAESAGFLAGQNDKQWLERVIRGDEVAARTLVQARTEGRPSDTAEFLVVFRERQGDGSWKHDYLLSNEIASDPPVEMAWVYKAEHRIEECLKTAKGEAGLADYQVRTWEGWHHHQCLSFLATWFLEEEARRGKNTDTGPDGACAAPTDRGSARSSVESPHLHPDEPHGGPQTQTQRGGPTLPLAAA